MSRVLPWLILLFTALALLPTPASAAARKPLQVLIVQSEDAVPQAQALTVALKRAVSRSPRYTLADGEFSLEVMTLALGCSDPPDGTCLAQIAAKIRSNQFVWGTMQRDGGKVIVHLRLWRRGASGSEVTARYAGRQDEEKLEELAGKLLARLDGESTASSLAETEAESEDPEPDAADEAPGDLVVHAGDVDGQLVIDGRAYGRIKNGYARVQVPPGEHEVVVRASGHYEAIADVVVKSKRRAQVTLYPERRDRPRRRRDAAQEGESNTGAGWAAIGVGAVLVGGGVYSAVKVKSINEEPDFVNYRSQFRQNQNVCTEAERGTERPGAAAPEEIVDLCSEARTYEALQYLFFGLGSVAIGTGALILITDSAGSSEPEKDEPRTDAVRAEPRVAIGEASAEVGVRLSF